MFVTSERLFKKEARYMKKMLALDLDGTTLNDASQMTDHTKKALEKARESGCVVCFVTGRSDVEMEPLRKYFHRADYLIINNGGKIVHSLTEEVIKKDLLPYHDTKKLVSFCLERQYTIYLISKGMAFTNTS